MNESDFTSAVEKKMDYIFNFPSVAAPEEGCDEPCSGQPLNNSGAAFPALERHQSLRVCVQQQECQVGASAKTRRRRRKRMSVSVYCCKNAKAARAQRSAAATEQTGWPCVAARTVRAPR